MKIWCFYIASYQVLLTISGHCLKKKINKSIASVYLFFSENLTVFSLYYIYKNKLYLWNSQLWHTAIPLLNSHWWRCWLSHSCIFTQRETSAHAVIPSLMGGLATMLCNRIKLIISWSEYFWGTLNLADGGFFLSRVPSSRLSQGVSHSAITELRGFRAAGLR